MTGPIGAEVDDVCSSTSPRPTSIPVDLIPLLSAHFAVHRDRLESCGDHQRVKRVERVLDELALAFTAGVARTASGDAADGNTKPDDRKLR